MIFHVLSIEISIHAFPHKNTTTRENPWRTEKYISIHAFPHKNATAEIDGLPVVSIFQSTHSLTRMRLGMSIQLIPVDKFQSTHSLTRMRRYMIYEMQGALYISIHAFPHKNATGLYCHQVRQGKNFNPRIPSQECDRIGCGKSKAGMTFQSTHSLTRMRPKIPQIIWPYTVFQSTHSLTRMRPTALVSVDMPASISIHAFPHKNATQALFPVALATAYFNPRIPSQECDTP